MEAKRSSLHEGALLHGEQADHEYLHLFLYDYQTTQAH